LRSLFAVAFSAAVAAATVATPRAQEPQERPEPPPTIAYGFDESACTRDGYYKSAGISFAFRQDEVQELLGGETPEQISEKLTEKLNENADGLQNTITLAWRAIANSADREDFIYPYDSPQREKVHKNLSSQLDIIGEELRRLVGIRFSGMVLQPKDSQGPRICTPITKKIYNADNLKNIAGEPYKTTPPWHISASRTGLQFVKIGKIRELEESLVIMKSTSNEPPVLSYFNEKGLVDGILDLKNKDDDYYGDLYGLKIALQTFQQYKKENNLQLDAPDITGIQIPGPSAKINAAKLNP